jgi:hypothetical protein
MEEEDGPPFFRWLEEIESQINHNEYRASIGLPALAHQSSMDSYADEEARMDSQSGVAHSAFGTCGESAQNECPNYGSTDGVLNTCLQAMWNEGPGQPYSEHGHYINMTNTAYHSASCGFYRTDGGTLWAVFNFYR